MSEIEYPIPLYNMETAREFRGAIEKARLCCDRVIESDKYQYALLISKRKDRNEYNIVYTGSVDGRVHVVSVDCDYMEELQPGRYRRVQKTDPSIPIRILKEAFFLIMVSKNNETKLGVIAHNGRVVLPPVNKNITDVLETFLVTFEDNENINVVYDYNGNHRLTVRGQPTIIHYGLEIDGETAAVMLVQKPSIRRVFIFYKGEIYQLYRDWPNRETTINVNDNRIIMGEKGHYHHQIIEVSQIKNILEHRALDFGTVIDDRRWGR